MTREKNQVIHWHKNTKNQFRTPSKVKPIQKDWHLLYFENEQTVNEKKQVWDQLPRISVSVAQPTYPSRS